MISINPNTQGHESEPSVLVTSAASPELDVMVNGKQRSSLHADLWEVATSAIVKSR
jgi:hypothetical protein